MVEMVVIKAMLKGKATLSKGVVIMINFMD